MQANEPEEIDELVLVVHGVGDPDPGATVSTFVRSLAESDTPLRETQHVRWLHDKDSSSDHIQTFPSHSRSLDLGGRKFEFAEVYWGDLSRVTKGWLGILTGLIQILFGLRYAAYVAADQNVRSGYRLKQLGLISSRILHGPVLAVNVFLLMLTCALSACQFLWGRESMGTTWLNTVLLACCALSFLFAITLRLVSKNRIVERFTFWWVVTACFVAALMLVKIFVLNPIFPDLAQHDQSHPCLIWYCRVLAVLMGMLWLMEMVVLVNMAGSWAVAMMDPRAHRPAIHLSFLLPALAVGVWGQALPMMWIGITVILDNTGQMPEFTAVFHEAIPLLGVQLGMALTILLTTALVIARYFWWRRSATVEKYECGDKPPRLIAHPALQLVLAVCTAIGISLVFLIGMFQQFGYQYTEIWGGEFLADVNKYAIMALAPMGGLLILVLPRLRVGFDILLDVVNHFYFRSTLIKDVLDDEDEFDIAETTFESGSLFFSRRDAIHYRFKKILTHFRDQLRSRTRLTIVSHSQGTMVAIEVLNDPELAWLNNCFSKVSLVTMGSPFSHLYQHYYGHHYPSLSHSFWKPFNDRVKSWTNIFRIDDFVGNEVNFVNSSSPPRPISFQHSLIAEERVSEQKNYPIGPRGHVSYWTDREALQVLREKVFREFKADIVAVENAA